MARTGIDPNGASLEGARNGVHHIDVLGPETGGKPIVALIGALDHLPLV